jgi:hypothetical protein
LFYISTSGEGKDQSVWSLNSSLGSGRPWNAEGRGMEGIGRSLTPLTSIFYGEERTLIIITSNIAGSASNKQDRTHSSPILEAFVEDIFAAWAYFRLKFEPNLIRG